MAKQSLAMMVFMAMVSEGYAVRVGAMKGRDERRLDYFNDTKESFSVECKAFMDMHYGDAISQFVPDCDDDALKNSYRAVQKFIVNWTLGQFSTDDRSWKAMHNTLEDLKKVIGNQRDKYFKENPEKDTFSQLSNNSTKNKPMTSPKAGDDLC